MTSSNSAESTAEVAELSNKEVASKYYGWAEKWARPDQLPPKGDWTTWLMMGGRGAGKTRAGAEWVRSLAAAEVSPIALVGETMTEVIAVMIRGESGLLNVHPNKERPKLKGTSLIWPNSVEGVIMSASDPDRFRGPQFAAAWFTELGCGAVDRGANQPNIFGDDKSSESGRPYFSSGTPDALIQRQFLRAHQQFWGTAANNPSGMLDLSHVYHWTWDARPFPAFPAQTDVWADGPNHRTGHWLTGRLGALASDEMARAIAADHGVPLAAQPASPLLHGLVLDQTSTGRDALEALIAASGLSLRAGAGGLALGQAALTWRPSRQPISAGRRAASISRCSRSARSMGRGMQAGDNFMARTRFERCLDEVLRLEGGYADHPGDPGGATNMGITRKTLARWRAVTPWWSLAKSEVQRLDRAEAAKIYRSGYWDRINAGKLPAGLDLALFDFAVNSGPDRAIKTLQSRLGVVTDGQVGPLTLKAIKTQIALKGAAGLIDALCDRRLDFLTRLATFAVFGAGWTARVAAIRKAALAAVGTEPSTHSTSSQPWSETMDVLSGYKTYIVAAFMLIAGLAQVLGIDLPTLDGGSAGHLIMEALAVIFLRKGLKGDIGNA